LRRAAPPFLAETCGKEGTIRIAGMRMDWSIGFNEITFSAPQVYTILGGACILFTLVLVVAGIVVALVTNRRRED